MATVAIAAAGPLSQAAMVKVVLLGGQSNMDGRAATSGLPTAPVNLQQPQNNVMFYYGSGPLQTLRPATAGGAEFGPEITFSQKIAADDPSSHYALIKYAVGGTSLAVNWAPSTGSAYSSFRTAVGNALNAITAAGDTYQIVGMLWLQGESDAADGYASQYQQNLTNFITDVRTRYGTNLPFIVGGIGYDGIDTGQVSAAQANVASAMTNVRYFDNSDLWPGGNGLHFDAAGQQIIGQRFATTFEAVPEPGSVSLLAIAATGLILRRRRRVTA